MLHSICQQIWKLSSGHKTGNGQFSFQSQREVKVKSLSHFQHFATHGLEPAPGFSVHGIFPGKNSGVGCHFLLQVIFPTQGIEPESLALRADTLPSESPGYPKKGNVKECSNYGTIALISHTSKVMLKIIPARLQQYVNCELPDVHAGFRKGRGTRGQIANIHWIIEKARELQKNIYFCFIDYAKAFDCVDHNKLWQILKEMGIPDHLICILRNWYVDQEATVRTGHGTTDWFQIRKGVHQGCILSPCLFNLYIEYIM